jgi:hypothetical protein
MQVGSVTIKVTFSEGYNTVRKKLQVWRDLVIINLLSTLAPGGVRIHFTTEFSRNLAEEVIATDLYEFITIVTTMTTLWPLHPSLLGFCTKRASQRYGLETPA